MAGITLPGQFTSQPQYLAQVNRSSPLAAGLLAAFTFPGKIPVNALNNTGAVATVGTVSNTPSPRGKAARMAATSLLSVVGNVSPLAYTHFAWVRVDNIVTWGGIFGVTNGAGSANVGSIGRIGSTDNLGNYHSTEAGTRYTWIGGAPVLADGKWHSIAVTCDGTAARQMYFDGNPVGSGGSLAGDNVGVDGKLVFFGERTAAAGFTSTGDYLLHFTWDRPQPHSNIISLHKNPWQIFQAPDRPSMFSDTAAAPSGYKPYWSSQRPRVYGAGVR